MSTADTARWSVRPLSHDQSFEQPRQHLQYQPQRPRPVFDRANLATRLGPLISDPYTTTIFNMSPRRITTTSTGLHRGTHARVVDVTNLRTWNLMIDLVAQTGMFPTGSPATAAALGLPLSCRGNPTTGCTSPSIVIRGRSSTKSSNPFMSSKGSVISALLAVALFCGRTVAQPAPGDPPLVVFPEGDFSCTAEVTTHGFVPKPDPRPSRAALCAGLEGSRNYPGRRNPPRYHDVHGWQCSATLEP